MTKKQFEALAKLIGLRSKSKNASELFFVKGLSVPEAAEKAGTTYLAAWRSVDRCKKAIDLCKYVAG